LALKSYEGGTVQKEWGEYLDDGHPGMGRGKMKGTVPATTIAALFGDSRCRQEVETSK